MYGKFACGCRIVEELLCCLTLHSTTGHDIFSAGDTFFKENQFYWGHVVECCIDGAPSMMGRNIGFRGILQRKFPHIHIKHCITHREALASKELSSVFNEVIQVVIKVVNVVKPRELNCRLFKQWRSNIACRPWISPILPPLHPMLVSTSLLLKYFYEHCSQCKIQMPVMYADDKKIPLQ